jgi:cytochrome c5
MSITLTSRIALVVGIATAGLALAQAPAPAPAPAPAGKPAPTAADPAKAKELVERMCSGCHEYGTVSSQNRTDTEWAETLDRMTGYGMQIAPEDQKQVQAFLTAHYGKKAD